LPKLLIILYILIILSFPSSSLLFSSSSIHKYTVHTTDKCHIISYHVMCFQYTVHNVPFIMIIIQYIPIKCFVFNSSTTRKHNHHHHHQTPPLILYYIIIMFVSLIIKIWIGIIWIFIINIIIIVVTIHLIIIVLLLLIGISIYTTRLSTHSGTSLIEIIVL